MNGPFWLSKFGIFIDSKGKISKWKGKITLSFWESYVGQHNTKISVQCGAPINGLSMS